MTLFAVQTSGKLEEVLDPPTVLLCAFFSYRVEGSMLSLDQGDPSSFHQQLQNGTDSVWSLTGKMNMRHNVVLAHRPNLSSSG